MVNVARVVIDLVLTDDGDELVEVETSPDLAFITALGMLRMAEIHLVDVASMGDDDG